MPARQCERRRARRTRHPRRGPVPRQQCGQVIGDRVERGRAGRVRRVAVAAANPGRSACSRRPTGRTDAATTSPTSRSRGGATASGRSRRGACGASSVSYTKQVFRYEFTMLYFAGVRRVKGDRCVQPRPRSPHPRRTLSRQALGTGMPSRPTPVIPNSSARKCATSVPAARPKTDDRSTFPPGAFTCSLIFQEPGRKASTHHHKIEELFFVHRGQLDDVVAVR